MVTDSQGKRKGSSIWFYNWSSCKLMVSFGFDVHVFSNPFGFSVRVWTPKGVFRFGKAM